MNWTIIKLDFKLVLTCLSRFHLLAATLGDVGPVSIIRCAARSVSTCHLSKSLDSAGPYLLSLLFFFVTPAFTIHEDTVPSSVICKTYSAFVVSNIIYYTV